MYPLTKTEQISLMIGGVILILAVGMDIIFSSNSQILENVIWAGASLIFSVIILYIFIIRPLASQHTEDYPSFISQSRGSFKPYINPPSKFQKKTQLRGQCGECNKQITLGFTCSYCNNYFCPEHRLPEKHRCTGMI